MTIRVLMIADVPHPVLLRAVLGCLLAFVVLVLVGGVVVMARGYSTPGLTLGLISAGIVGVVSAGAVGVHLATRK